MSELKVNTISEVTGANGVVIDSVKLKDGGVIIADAGNIGSASDTDAIAISSGGVVTFSQAPVFPNGSIDVLDLDIDGATDIGAAIVDADLFIVDDGAGGTNRKVTASRIKTYAATSGDVTAITSLLATDRKIGEDDQTKIDFETADEIHFYAANAEQVFVSDGVFGPQTDSDVDLGTTGVRWKNAYIDTITTTGASQLETLGVGAAKDLGVALHVKSGDSGASVDGGGDELVVESSGAGGISILTGNSSTGKLAFGDDGAANKFSVNYDHSTDLMKISTASAVAIQMTQDGEVTKPLQPAFFVTKNGSQNNIPINATTTVEWQIEAFDQNGDFASHTFTAPVTGRYAFSALINWSSWDTDFGYAWHRITTSNRTIFANIGSGNQVTADGYFFASSSILCDMDANDTCKIEIQFSNDGATQADIMQSSFFSGHLVC